MKPKHTVVLVATSLISLVVCEQLGATGPLRRAVSSRQPVSARTTNWDHYCKGDGQNFCEFLIYAGKNGFTENYTLDIGNQGITSASIKFSAALEDAPDDPSFTSYCLQISINDNIIQSPFVLRNIRHGRPLGGPFSFTDEVIKIPAEAYSYFRNGSNNISYKLDCAPSKSWIVFKSSEVTIFTK